MGGGEGGSNPRTMTEDRVDNAAEATIVPFPRLASQTLSSKGQVLRRRSKGPSSNGVAIEPASSLT